MTAGGECRSCGSPGLVPIVSLGLVPLANALRTLDELDRREPRYPLEAALCRFCSLLQLTEIVAPEILFHEYPYLSSASDGMVDHARSLAQMLVAQGGLGPRSLVFEIGSNDGYFLQHVRALGVPVLGVEPARAAREAALGQGIPTLGEFFDLRLARRLAETGHRADVVVANNVMAHVPAINDLVGAVQVLLKPSGVFVLETPYVRELVERQEFDTIYHEHVFYYSLTALASLLNRHGLEIVRVERIAIHGGSLRVTAALAAPAADPAMRALLDEEAVWGVRDPATYERLARGVLTVSTRLRELLVNLKGRGWRLAAYGAAAKGAILLHVAEVGPDLLDFVVDRNPLKQGRFMPGSAVPIQSPEQLLVARPDAVLLLAWNLEAEVLAQQGQYRRLGGRFIIPGPEPRLV
jgi:SAM-dependent methyltransferase